MSAPTILVQMDDHKWTLAALHQACAEAKTNGANVALALMLPECHCVLGNIDVKQYAFSETECEELDAYQKVASSYGIPLSVRVFEYRDLESGLAEAADALNAGTVYAHVTGGFLPGAHQRIVRHMEHTMEAHHHHLRALEIPLVSPN